MNSSLVEIVPNDRKRRLGPRKEDFSRSRTQLESIGRLSDVDAQFIATLIDTEAAIGYYSRRYESEAPVWTAYISVKMKHRGLIARFALLSGLKVPLAPTLSKNTLTGKMDPRWSKQLTGIVAVALLQRVRPRLFNEKTIAEADCIIASGPAVRLRTHPFVTFGATRVRRGVWSWPSAR